MDTKQANLIKKFVIVPSSVICQRVAPATLHLTVYWPGGPGVHLTRLIISFPNPGWADAGGSERKCAGCETPGITDVGEKRRHPGRCAGALEKDVGPCEEHLWCWQRDMTGKPNGCSTRRCTSVCTCLICQSTMAYCFISFPTSAPPDPGCEIVHVED